MSKLVIVESPAKAKTIRKYLGGGYEVTASMGHIRDLPQSQLGIDVEHGYAPQYINIKGKEAIVREAVSRTNSSTADCLLVGDSGYDARGAQDAGIDFCAVLWGFGFSKIEDAAQFTCRYIAEDVPALERFLLK